MTYEQAIEYINRFSKSGTPVKDLVRFVILMRSLGNPHNEIKIIHVAGTNGKGSVCEYIVSALQAAGSTVGKFTSPYIDCMEERIQINGRYISKPAFALLCDRVRNAVIANGYDGYSRFEILTAIAFLYFSKEQVNYAVVETGIGGSMDCTNVVNPILSVITSIDYDHTSVLGNTLEEIAWHKAGIIKPGVPCVCAPEQNVNAQKIIAAKCREFNSELIVPDLNKVAVLHMDISDCFFSYHGMNYHTRMSGKHQISNALCAIESLRKLGVSYTHVFTGIEKAVLPARMEIIRRDDVSFIIDGAHNPAAARAAVEFLNLERETPIFAVMGMLSTKDWKKCIDISVPRFSAVAFVDGFCPECEPAANLMRYALSKEAKCTMVSDIERAVNQAADLARENGGYAMITGSLYLASTVRKILLSSGE